MYICSGINVTCFFKCLMDCSFVSFCKINMHKQICIRPSSHLNMYKNGKMYIRKKKIYLYIECFESWDFIFFCRAPNTVL